MRVGTVADHFRASKADYEGGDYSPEAETAVRAYERNRPSLLVRLPSPSHPSSGSVSNDTPLLLERGSTGCVRDGTGLSCARRHLNGPAIGNEA
jgi:hypothetical protein